MVRPTGRARAASRETAASNPASLKTVTTHQCRTARADGVLDAGCNRRRVPPAARMIECGIAEGFGYDPASGAIEDARRLDSGSGRSRSRPGDTVPAGWGGFDAAFSSRGALPARRSSLLTPERSSARWCPVACTTRSWVFTPAAR